MLSPIITRAEPTSPVSQMKETFRRMSAQRDAAAEWRTPDRRDSQQPQQYPPPNSLLFPFRNSSGPSFASPYSSTPTTTGIGLSSSTVPHYNPVHLTSNPPHAALSSSSTTPYDRMITIGGSGSRSTVYSKSPPSMPRPFPSQLPAPSGDEDQFDRGYAERRLEERTSRGSPRVFSEAAPVNTHSSSHPPTPPRWAPSSSSGAVGGRGPQPVTFLPNRTAANGAPDDDRLPQPILFPTDTFAPPPPMQSPLPRVPQQRRGQEHSDGRESSYRDGTVSSGSGSNQRNSRSVSGSAGARHAPAAAAEYSDEFPLSFVTASIEGPHISDFYGRAIPVPTALATAAPPEVLATFNGARAPSALLSTIVEAVWIARGGRQPQQQPPVIPNEVVDAFDGLLYDGAYFVKYSPHGTPHERYFAIRMVEVSGVSREPCLTWSVHKTSWSMKGVVNLAELHSIVEGTVDCPAFERHLIDAFHIKGPMFRGPKRATLSTECTVQLIGGAEPLALLGLNAAVFKALLVFLRYIAKVGRGETNSRRSYPR